MAPLERRQNARLPVCADVKGGVILIEHLDILDLSFSGVRFCCTKRLNPGQRVDLELRREALHVHRRGNVVRSAFVGAVRIDGREHTSYEVAVAFEDVPCAEPLRADLSRLMRR